MEAASLPELASVPWRRRVDPDSLRRRGRWWTATTVAHSVPLAAIAVAIFVLAPLAVAVSAIVLAKALIIPALYAQRGANVVRTTRRAGAEAETRAAGLLGDLVGHDARELYARTGLVLERGGLGVWLLGEAGAVLVAPGGRRAWCWCVKAADASLPSADRVAHLLLALREDEAGFATVANLAFSGAPRRVRARMEKRAKPALTAAVAAAQA
ncbi:MAG: hypothetical protein QOE65_2574 [Solirubrobacteraceae bacterium]|nr:hypothetical protein [Solirubrobacteraceae bacterium]